MKRATFTVLFYIKRTKVLKDGTAPIFARATINGDRTEFGLQKSIDSTEWDSVKGCAKGYSRNAKELNAELEAVKFKLQQHKRELDDTNLPYSATDLKNAYLGFTDKNKTILEIFREHNEKCKGLENKDFAPGTIERYSTCYKHVSDFITSKYKKTDLFLNEITPMFISDFEYYLKTKRNCCNNTTIKYIKNFKKIIRIALANGWMKSDPFVNIKYHMDAVDMDFLSEAELDELVKKEFKMDRLQQVKDIYVFCCFTGLAFIDVKSLCKADLITEPDGSLWIKKKRQKTKNWCHIPLLKPAANIISKYEKHPQTIKTGKLLPVLSNQKMNAYIKEIADVCGIQKNLSTHTARHTFATTVTLANQISIEVVSKMLGHSSINMTKKYARVVDDLIKRDMQKLSCKYDVAV